MLHSAFVRARARARDDLDLRSVRSRALFEHIGQANAEALICRRSFNWTRQAYER